MCLLAQARRLRDRSPASQARHVPARRSGPLSLMPRLVRGPYGSTRQITLPLSHHFCWQKCSPPHYFALSGSTPHLACVLQTPPSPLSPPAPACAAPPNFDGGLLPLLEAEFNTEPPHKLVQSRTCWLCNHSNYIFVPAFSLWRQISFLQLSVSGASWLACVQTLSPGGLIWMSCFFNCENSGVCACVCE